MGVQGISGAADPNGSVLFVGENDRQTIDGFIRKPVPLVVELSGFGCKSGSRNLRIDDVTASLTITYSGPNWLFAQWSISTARPARLQYPRGVCLARGVYGAPVARGDMAQILWSVAARAAACAAMGFAEESARAK